MARTPSTMKLELQAAAPSFTLKNVDGTKVSLTDFKGKPVLVTFVCNHCPFVIHVRQGIAELNKDYMPQGVAFMAINSNDPEAYPEDHPDKMKAFAEESGWKFPYLFDADQSVAKAYYAACTPDFFLFDSAHKLFYRGQLDDSRPGNGIAVTGADLRKALDTLLASRPWNGDQKPSIGCNIKWRAGNEPEYFTR